MQACCSILIMRTDKQRVGEVKIFILGVPPTNYMTLFKSLGQASLCFSSLSCHWGFGWYVLWRHQQMELNLQYRARWKRKSHSQGLLALSSLLTIFCGSTERNFVLLLPALTFNSDLITALVFCSEC